MVKFRSGVDLVTNHSKDKLEATPKMIQLMKAVQRTLLEYLFGCEIDELLELEVGGAAPPTPLRITYSGGAGSGTTSSALGTESSPATTERSGAPSGFKKRPPPVTDPLSVNRRKRQQPDKGPDGPALEDIVKKTKAKETRGITKKQKQKQAKTQTKKQATTVRKLIAGVETVIQGLSGGQKKNKKAMSPEVVAALGEVAKLVKATQSLLSKLD